MRIRAFRLSAAAAVAVLSALPACASVEKGQYGVAAIDFEGMDQMDEEAVERCLLSVERERFEIPLGLSESECNAPPFDSSPPSIGLWRWPWTEWPIFNPAVVDVDRERIERWYRARGFYDARVTAIRYVPKGAAVLGADIAEGQCDPQKEECSVEIKVFVEEGAPLLVGSVTVEGIERLSAQAQASVLDAKLPSTGARFDELDYDAGKKELLRQLAEVSYAGASIAGEVTLDHDARLAHVRYRVAPGPAYRFGHVRIQGAGTLPRSPIRAAAGIKIGTPFRQSALTEVQHEVYALGAFSSVEVELLLNPGTRLAHLSIKVAPLPRDAFRVGVGVTSGMLQRTDTGAVSVPQWDVHLLARYERRHVFHTLGKLRIEERPRLIFPSEFPSTVDDPALGNVVRVRLNQPGVVEARTDLIFETQWDYGPEPFIGYTRHDVMGRVSAKRAFLRRRVFGSFALQHDRFLVPNEDSSNDPDDPESFAFSYVEQDARLDLRNDQVQPRSGIYLGLVAIEAVRSPISDWSMIQLAPEVRGYIPLPFHMVLATRFALGANFILAASDDLRATNKELGPTTYRLRGGGAQSNRGFVAGELGAGIEGGLRRWESLTELRIRLGSAFGLVGFYDMGDVIRGEVLHFTSPNPAAGFGLRYLTIVGAIRFDVGFRLGRVTASEKEKLIIFNTPGAMHLTIGEAF